MGSIIVNQPVFQKGDKILLGPHKPWWKRAIAWATRYRLFPLCRPVVVARVVNDSWIEVDEC